jgi:hypothetical protein
LQGHYNSVSHLLENGAARSVTEEACFFFFLGPSLKTS